MSVITVPLGADYYRLTIPNYACTTAAANALIITKSHVAAVSLQSRVKIEKITSIQKHRLNSAAVLAAFGFVSIYPYPPHNENNFSLT